MLSRRIMYPRAQRSWAALMPCGAPAEECRWEEAGAGLLHHRRGLLSIVVVGSTPSAVRRAAKVQRWGRFKKLPAWRRKPALASALGGVSPGLVPVLARGIDDAAIGLEELVGDLEDREHKPALRTPSDAAAPRLPPAQPAALPLY